MRFLGYDPANVKIVAYVVAAAWPASPGRCFAPDRRHHLAHQFGVVPSILMFVIGVAVGGRATLLGAGARRDRAWQLGADHVRREQFPRRLALPPGAAVRRGGGFFPPGWPGVVGDVAAAGAAAARAGAPREPDAVGEHTP